MGLQHLTFSQQKSGSKVYQFSAFKLLIVGHNSTSKPMSITTNSKFNPIDSIVGGTQTRAGSNLNKIKLRRKT
ncbi:hypothetical protein GYH30_009519 [Glycine max]|uniref:Uncharacterized protein n=1 Tax=Glycine max TaxID=3847 RepID=A0A0R0K6P4_SOYBN|nr:hypothetical protein GYH30_009519 [Glycine max]